MSLQRLSGALGRKSWAGGLSIKTEKTQSKKVEEISTPTAETVELGAWNALSGPFTQAKYLTLQQWREAVAQGSRNSRGCFVLASHCWAHLDHVTGKVVRQGSLVALLGGAPPALLLRGCRKKT